MSQILEFQNVSLISKGEAVLDSVNISFESNCIYCITGPSGSGKSVFLKLAAGFATPSSGNLLVCGNSISKKERNSISYLNEGEIYADFRTVADVFSFYTDFFSDFDKEKAFSLFDEAKISLKDKLKELSEITRKKLAVIMTVCRSANLYMFDNPVKGVDPAAKNFILSAISSVSADSAVLVSSDSTADVESIISKTVIVTNGHARFKE